MTMREICEIYIFEKYETRLNNLRIHFQPHSKHYNYTGLIHYLSSSQYAVYLMANRPVGSKSPENQIVGWMWPSFGLDRYRYQYCFSKKWHFVPFHRRNTNIRLKNYKTTLSYQIHTNGFRSSESEPNNGWFQTLFRWILKSLDFEISIISSDSQ